MDLPKQLYGILKEANRLDLYEKMSESWEKNDNLRNEIDKLRETLAKLKKKIDSENSYSLERGVYWQKTDNNRTQPFCPTCFSKELEIPLQPDRGWDKLRDTGFHCPSCNAYYNPWDYREPTQTTYEGPTW